MTLLIMPNESNSELLYLHLENYRQRGRQGLKMTSCLCCCRIEDRLNTYICSYVNILLHMSDSGVGFRVISYLLFTLA